LNRPSSTPACISRVPNDKDIDTPVYRLFVI